MPDTALFRPELFEFLRQLRRHNDREWFAKNKARYQQVIVEPALLFIGGFAPHLAEISPFFVADPRSTRGSLFRIYRDTRFSPEQAPVQDARNPLLLRQRQGCACACVLSASGAGELLRGGGRLASGQPRPDQNPHGDCGAVGTVGEAAPEAGTGGRQPYAATSRLQPQAPNSSKTSSAKFRGNVEPRTMRPTSPRTPQSYCA